MPARCYVVLQLVQTHGEHVARCCMQDRILGEVQQDREPMALPETAAYTDSATQLRSRVNEMWEALST